MLRAFVVSFVEPCGIACCVAPKESLWGTLVLFDSLCSYKKARSDLSKSKSRRSLRTIHELNDPLNQSKQLHGKFFRNNFTILYMISAKLCHSYAFTILHGNIHFHSACKRIVCHERIRNIDSMHLLHH